MIIYFLWKTLIILLNIEEINIYTKYFGLINIFSYNSTIELLEYITIDNYLMELVYDK